MKTCKDSSAYFQAAEGSSFSKLTGPEKGLIMIELRPEEKPGDFSRPKKNPEMTSPESRPPAMNDLRLFVKGSLSLFARFIEDVDWFLTTINSKDKS